MYHLVHKIPHKANYEIYFQKCTVSPFWCPYFFFFLLSHYKSQRIQMPPMLCPTGNNINSGRINTAVPQNIRQTGNIFIYRIETPGKQMAKIMRKYFLCIHPRIPAQVLHHFPYITPVQRPPRARNKYRSLDNSFPSQIIFEFFLKLLWDQNCPGLSFKLNHSLPAVHRRRRDIF